jgi:putative hydrolase
MTLDETFDRIVYLLDRSLAPSPKVRAFQTARAIAAELGDEELRRRIDAGTLTDLEGIGASTGGVIAEALAGDEPAYLTKLEASTDIPLDEGTDLRAALRGDCHLHSTWSDGGASIRSMAETARRLGHEYIVMTDHSPRLTIAHGLGPDRLREQMAEIAALNEELAPFRILTGIEVDIFEDGTLDQDDELLAELDVVVASVHSKLKLPREEMTRRMVLAISSPHTDILGHCTNRQVMGRGRPPSEFDAEIVFAACRETNTAVEINCRPERQDPPDELLGLAVELHCPIAIDTDAHARGQLEWLNFGCDKAVRHGTDTTAVVNTRTADDLLAWTASHDAG